MRRYLPLALAAATVTGLATPAVAAAPVFTPGAAGAGDHYFPLQGNGGYDATHYALRIGYTPATRRLTGVATVTATATQNLSAFDLDLRGLTVSSVTVDGRPAKFRQHDVQELTVTPGFGIHRGRSFVTTVRYAGHPQVVTDPDNSIEGVVPTTDGAVFVGEPQGSPAWFPSNDTPADKATYDVAVTVPEGLVGVSNGSLLSRRTAGGRTTFRWSQPFPTASYLVTATVGKFRLTRTELADGTPVWDAVDPTLAAKADPVVAKLPAIIAFYSRRFGAWPYAAAGAIVDDAPDVGYSLETETRPIFAYAPDEETFAHELAHQWFGDDVSVRHWRDIWLNEGFATWSEWLWEQHIGNQSLRARFAALMKTPADSGIWSPPPGRPGGPRELFAGSVYVRGGLALEALREKIGEHDFDLLLRTWLRDHRYGNGTEQGFRALASRISGTDLRHFFTVWLDDAAKPTSW